MTKSKVITALALMLAATPVFANGVPVPEPGIVPMLAVGAVAGLILYWKNRRKK